MEFIQRRFFTFGIFKTLLYSAFLFLCLSAIANLFDFHDNGIIILFVIAIIFLNLFSSGLEVYKSNIFTRTILSFCEIFVWISLMYGFLTLFIFIIGIFIQINKELLFIIYLTIVPLLTIYGYINAHRIQITEREVSIKNLREEINILHISDLHVGSIRNSRMLKQLTKKINLIGGDLVIISGDLADGSCQIDDSSFLPLKESKVPIIFTPGNHDIYPGLENVISGCKNANIHVLIKGKFVFKGLNIYPLPVLPNFRSFTNDLSLLNLQDININEVNILINHFPLNWEYFRNNGINLQLSGHTHGGQFIPFNFLVKTQFRYITGLYEFNGSYLSVTDGVGTIQPPIRLGTRSEIILLKLKKS
ncbi:metallophosphoesterase [Methanobrevibacter curvatus]|uniref:Putative metallophosphoesterase n=1 Tax=Methanobrevibacter curvatus TaxID=49547 RepID=A0A166B540_9EURY|nr:metallophosphoesterase [Methanobrevibacter curvatus]KZX12873.1 putative metallophosphoesterase [Methanobrevibacter curvatus]